MKVQNIKRIFLFKSEKLEDINTDLTPEQVLNHYSGIYPELNNAKILNKGIKEENSLVYEFKNIVGTKG